MRNRIYYINNAEELINQATKTMEQASIMLKAAQLMCENIYLEEEPHPLSQPLR